MNLLILAQIASAFGALAQNPAFGGDGAKVSAIAGLVGLAFQTGGMIESERAVLLEQVQRANSEGRLLTDEEMSAWKVRHAAANAAIQDWQPGS